MIESKKFELYAAKVARTVLRGGASMSLGYPTIISLRKELTKKDEKN